MDNLDIQISKIKYDLDIQDMYGATNERIFQLSGYKIEYYLNKYIRSSIDIKTDKELTIDEIKDKIRETYRGNKGKELIYKDLFDKFKKEYSPIGDIDDYRPSGKNAIDVWLKDGTIIHATYYKETDHFIVSTREKGV